jgi:hypothetical protein
MLGNITEGHGLGQMAGSYEDGNEPLGFIKYAECLEWLRNRELFVQDSTPWSLFSFVVFHYLDVPPLTSFFPLTNTNLFFFYLYRESLSRNTNKMQFCNRIYYSKVY